jgi:hypothetical protein
MRQNGEIRIDSQTLSLSKHEVAIAPILVFTQFRMRTFMKRAGGFQLSG